jgi:hypothetical protein
MTNSFLHTFHSSSSNSQPTSIFVYFLHGCLNKLTVWHVWLSFQPLIFSQPAVFFSHINQPTIFSVAYFQSKRTSFKMLTYSKLEPLLNGLYLFYSFLSLPCTFLVHTLELPRCKEGRGVQEGAIHLRKGASKAHVAGANCLESYYKRLLEKDKI